MKKKENKTGRPKAIIDWNKVDRFLEAQCDGVGIASILGIDPETLYKRCKLDNNVGFSEYAATKKARGVELLKAKQFQTAMNGNVTMQIWLGKQYAGQKDRQDITSDNERMFEKIEITVDSQKTADTFNKLIGKG